MIFLDQLAQFETSLFLGFACGFCAKKNVGFILQILGSVQRNPYHGCELNFDFCTNKVLVFLLSQLLQILDLIEYLNCTFREVTKGDGCFLRVLASRGRESACKWRERRRDKELR